MLEKIKKAIQKLMENIIFNIKKLTIKKHIK